jgi:hypothetical protein
VPTGNGAARGLRDRIVCRQRHDPWPTGFLWAMAYVVQAGSYNLLAEPEDRHALNMARSATLRRGIRTA